MKSGVLGTLRAHVVTAFTQNLGLKGFALVASLLIYSLVHGTEEQPQPIAVDVRVLLPPPSSGRVLVSDVPDEVWITVKGSASIIQSLDHEDIPPVQVDLRGAAVRTFYFEESMFRLPSGVKFVDIEASDASFPLAWETLVTRRLPVRVDTSGGTAPGSRVEQPVVTQPREITVVGAESRVTRLTDVETEPVDVSGLGIGDHDRPVTLRRPPPHTQYDREGSIHAKVQVVPDLVERLYPGRPVTAVGGQLRLEVRPGTVDVRLRGPREVMADVSGDRLLPFVDGEALDAAPDETTRVAPRLEDLPPSVEVVEFIPARVFVVARRGPAKRP
jgi:YbbR domain-containing protein